MMERVYELIYELVKVEFESDELGLVFEFHYRTMVEMMEVENSLVIVILKALVVIKLLTIVVVLMVLQLDLLWW